MNNFRKITLGVQNVGIGVAALATGVKVLKDTGVYDDCKVVVIAGWNKGKEVVNKLKSKFQK